MVGVALALLADVIADERVESVAVLARTDLRSRVAVRALRFQISSHNATKE